MVRALRDRENIQTVGKFPSPPPHLPLKHLCFIVFDYWQPTAKLGTILYGNSIDVKHCHKDIELEHDEETSI
jgi:hypothetical protein